jgi:hypothetical protein
MKSEILKFFNSIANVGLKLKRRLNYVVIVPQDDGVFIATNLSDKIIDDLPIDKIAEVMRDTAEKQSSEKQPDNETEVTYKGVRH